MPQYRFSRTLPTGWKMRLEYLTWDTNYGGAVTEIDETALVELGEHTAQFDNDGLPFGLTAPQTLALTLNYTQLPAGMRAYLKYGYETTLPPNKFLKRNTWWLWTDRGTNGVTWTLEFIGCEETTEGVDLEPAAGDTYEYSVELVDVVYHAMKTCTGYECFRTVTAPTVAGAYFKLFNILVVNESGRNVFQTTYGADMISAQNLLLAFGEGVSNFLETYYLRSGTLYPIGTFFDVGAIFTAALELKESTVASLPRTTGATLTDTTTYLIWKLTGLGSPDLVGGLSSKIDKYGWAREDLTPWDILHDLAENMGVKLSYDFVYVSAFNSVNMTCKPRRVGATLTYGNTSANTYDARLGTDKMLERAKIIKRGSGIAKAEVQFDSEFSEDAKTVVRLSSSARGSRSMNIEPIVHNIPTFQQSTEDDRRGRYGPPLQSNLIYWKRSDAGAETTYVLAHENTRYRYLPGTSGAYVDATTTAGQTPIRHLDDDENVGEYRLQLNAIQTGATMQTALAKFAVHVFGNEQNAIVETSWSLLHTTEAMPNKLGAVHDLSYAQDNGTGGASYLATAFDEMNWARCILTKSAVDYVAGTVTVTYYLLSQNGNLA